MATTQATAKKTTSVTKTAANAKAAEKQPAVAKAAKAPAKKTADAVPKQPAAKRAKTLNANSTPTPEQRYCMVAEAAYFRAERQGFLGDPVQDWIEAEAEIEAFLNGK
ncbi:MAG: DUF2934 domain-containing protein [Sulfuricella sp.]|nr:DUF2934 domain-containing protein [Sulfuricella sp.]